MIGVVVPAHNEQEHIGCCLDARHAIDSVRWDRHIHGANLGVSALAYEEAGGFPLFAQSEGVGFVKALRHSCGSIAWSPEPRVTTSARRAYRAIGGFDEYLVHLDQESALHRPQHRSVA